MTNQERDTLLSDYRTDNEKINDLMRWLPRKGSDSLERFVRCLEKSSEGTSHSILAKKIKSIIKKEPSMDPVHYTMKSQVIAIELYKFVML